MAAMCFNVHHHHQVKTKTTWRAGEVVRAVEALSADGGAVLQAVIGVEDAHPQSGTVVLNVEVTCLFIGYY